MGMAEVELVGTMAIYYVNGVEICRQVVTTSGVIEVPPIVFAAMGSNEINLSVKYQAFDRRDEFRTRAERRGQRAPKKSYGPQKHWYNRR
jgi:hypothetical protein